MNKGFTPHLFKKYFKYILFMPRKKGEGFTILEIILAILIITIGVLGAFTVVQRIISGTMVASSRLIAAYLAKEGIEVVRNIRDANWLDGQDWDKYLVKGKPSGFNGCNPNGSPPRYCEADYNDTQLTERNTNQDPAFLKIDNSFYNYDSGFDTKFKRKITVVAETDKLKIFVEIQWQEKGQNYTLTVQENLYDWE